MKMLERAKKVNLPNKGWVLRKLTKNHEELLMKLDLVPNAEQDVKESKVQSSKSA